MPERPALSTNLTPNEIVFSSASIAVESRYPLDPDTAQTVLDLLGREIRSRGAGGVLVTHSEAAARSADRVVVLDHGKLREHAAA